VPLVGNFVYMQDGTDRQTDRQTNAMDAVSVIIKWSVEDQTIVLQQQLFC